VVPELATSWQLKINNQKMAKYKTIYFIFGNKNLSYSSAKEELMTYYTELNLRQLGLKIINQTNRTPIQNLIAPN